MNRNLDTHAAAAHQHMEAAKEKESLDEIDLELRFAFMHLMADIANSLDRLSRQ